MTLKDRCLKFLKDTFILVEPEDVDDLAAFVVAEVGRAVGGEVLERSLPLCLYFPTDRDREEFIAMIEMVKPNLVTKRMP